MLGLNGKTATGIHWSGDRGWLVSLCRRRSGLEPVALVEFELPASVDAASLADPEVRSQLVDVLHEVGEEYEVDFSNTCFALDPSMTLIKKSALVPGSEREMREHLAWEAEQFLVGEQRAFSIDYVMESEWGLFVAVRRSALDWYLDVGRMAGVRRVDVDVPAFALYNAGECAGLLPNVTASELLVYAGAREAHILLVDQGELMQTAACSWGPDDDATDVLHDAVYGALREVGGRVECAWCAGAGVEEWGAQLADRFECEMAIIDPLAGLEVDEYSPLDPAQRSQYAIAAGLAQRGVLA